MYPACHSAAGTAPAKDLFTNRHLFVRHYLSGAQKELLRRLTRGLRQLRALRAIMDEAYRLFDRRCKTRTAVTKLAQLRVTLRETGRIKATQQPYEVVGVQQFVFRNGKLLEFREFVAHRTPEE
jgi:hypothetical protein